MRRFITTIVLALLVGLLTFAPTQGDERLGKRPTWVTSRIQGTPDPLPPYQVQRVFTNLTFDEPVILANPSKSDRMFVAERFGKIYSFQNQQDIREADLCLDVDSTIYGLALHPDFDRNGYLYVTYLNPRVKGRYILPEECTPKGTRVSRFQVVSHDPPRCDPNSEHVILQWPSGGHNGGCLKFGPDGYLYVTLGDSSEIADMNNTGQDLSDLLASILRIDVDHPDPGRGYGIPNDNPFINRVDARPEIWAYGLRQVWKMSFDRETGQLWAGDVGQDLWEIVHRIVPGGNYGWSVTEGSHAFRPERKRGPTPILPPVHEYSHTEGRSITGGYVYRGRRLKELVGTYLFADYDSGRVWGLRYDGNDVVWHKLLCNTTQRIVAFGEDNNGEIYLVDHIGGKFYRLVATENSAAHQDFPRQLSQTGIFSNVSKLTPAAGVIPFSINARSWSDGVHKEWLLAIPDNKKIEFDGMKYPDPEVPAGWKFPDGTVVVETISMEMVSGDPASRRRLETRILHHQQLSGTEEMGDQYWMGYTYLWNDQQTDAVLLEDPQGLDETLTIHDPQDASLPSGFRTMKWHYPSRAECTVCHNMSARYILSGNTSQLNRDHAYGEGVVTNQLRAFQHWNLFSEPLTELDGPLPRLADPENNSLSIEVRARGYLHANCAFCHRKWGGGNADFKLVYTLDLDKTGLVNVPPVHGTFHIPGAQLIAPGDPYRSVLFYRLAKLGNGRMPRSGSQIIDTRGLQLVHDWIQNMPGSENPTIRSGNKDDVAISDAQNILQNPSSMSESRAAANQLLDSTLGALVLSWTIESMSDGDKRRQDLVQLGAKHPDPNVRDLFERFLPTEQRTERLGEVVDLKKILTLKGNIARGRELFLEAGVQCRSCHRVHGTGIALGPELDEIGKKYDRAQLLETIVEPSKKIDPKYMAFLATTTEGKAYTGLLVERTPKGILLKTARNETIRLATSEIEDLEPQEKSFMPDQMLRDLTARDAADLLAYLGSLK